MLRSNLTRVIRIVVVWSLLGELLASHLPAQTAPYRDLETLGRASGKAYVTLRTRMLESQRALRDVDAATRSSWEAGLAALIVNAGMKDRERFAKWDAFPLTQKQGPGYFKHPATTAGADGQAYLIEQLWKTASVPEVRADAFHALLWQKIEGPVSLWRAVWQNARQTELKDVALHAIAKDETPAARDILLKVLKDKDSPSQSKLAALTGLYVAKFPYATEVVLQSLPSWEKDLELVGHGFRALAVQPEGRARQALHQIALDSGRAEGIRQTALISFTDQPQPADIAVLEALLTKPAPAKLKARAGSSLSKYPIEQIRPLLHKMLSNPPNEDVLYWTVMAVEMKGEVQDIAALKAVSERKGVPDRLRRMAATAAKTLERRSRVTDESARKISVSTSIGRRYAAFLAS